MKKISLLFLALLLTVSCFAEQAELKVFPLFTDHGILQQDTTVPIWGTSAPGAMITVSFRDAKATAAGDAAGKWVAHLKTPKAEPGKDDGYDLIISTGKQQIVLHDVVVGEVWFGSGQSNIDTKMSMYLVGKAEIPKADIPGIRLYSAGDTGGKSVTGDFSKYQWNRCNPTTAANASATGYFFCRELHKALKVPVGFMNMAVGGSPLSAWVLPEWLSADSRTAPHLEKFKKETYPAFIQTRKEQLAKWQQAAEEAKAKGKQPSPAWPPFQGPADQPVEHFIGEHYRTHTGMIMPFVFKGMLWDQGESTVGYALGGSYDDYFDVMMKNLRKGFGYELPVVYCQMPKGGSWGPTIHVVENAFLKEPGESIPLADLPTDAPKAGPVFEGFEKESDPFIRMNALPQCFMATTRDLQAALHPPDKDAYGARFCISALNQVYGKNIEWFGPVITSAKRAGQEIQISFDHMGSGLVALGGKPLQGFYVSDPKGKSTWVQCRIENDKVIFSGDGIKTAETVSYANFNRGRVMWANLFNKEGLPAYPMTVKVQ